MQIKCLHLRNVHLKALIIVLSVFMQKTKGDCLYEGNTYKRNTLWSPNSCSICTCEDPVVMCENVRCSSPNCDSKKGEYLQIPAEGCCPECVRRMSPCQYESQTTPHNSVWSPDRCKFCHCYDGEVTCTDQSCPTLRCRPGEVSQILADHCCPQCIPTGRPCEYAHHVFQDATEWSPIPCTMCVCRDGQTICYPIQCPSFVCPQGKSMERRPGSCCPSCVGSYCTDAMIHYKNGDHWDRDSCTTCTCIQGEIVCSRKDCMIDFECEGKELNITRESECCSECILPKDTCTSERPARYHGDIWNVTDCEFCTCRQGKVQCFTAVCEPAICLENEMLIHQPGKCCKECVPRPTCYFGGEMFHTGDSWQPDSCTLCQCGHGDMVCFSKTCPICPEGSIGVPQPGECCGKCQKMTCASECKHCKVTDSNQCTECKISGLYLQDGRCVQKCKDGLYADRKNKCHACHDSCKTCVDLTRYHCQTCKPGLLWREGECVSRCGMGYYQETTHCYSCDTSCSLCLGPKDNQCLACSQNGLVLQSGRCVDHCSSSSYLQNGECLECPATCQTCSSDGQSCTSCYDSLVLHRGQCLSQCPKQYFPSYGACNECHPSCKSCSGPTDTNCLSCADGSKLSKKGRCKMPCLDGQYLTKDSTCKDCGFGCGKCHTSRDGTTSVCLQCLNPSMVAFDDICMRACPVGRYKELGICRVCGSGCLRCESNSICHACGPNQIVSDGICVRHCKPTQYVDGWQCKDCPEHCMECMSSTDCSQCDGQTYLLNRQCVPTCGKGYYQNKKSRRCERNEQPPTIQLTGHIQVEEKDTTEIPASIFNLNDPDTPLESLVIIVAEPPTNGNHIVKCNMGMDVILEAGDTITPQELKDGKVRFIHNSPVLSAGRISFKAFDRQLYSTERVLHIQVINDHPPQLVRNEHVLATVGEITPFDSQILELKTLDPVKTLVNVIEGPLHGKFIDQGTQSPVSSFSVEELHTSSIGYQLNPLVTAARDMCIIQVTDGYHVLSFIVNFEIRQKENLSPLIVNNEVGHVYAKDMLRITPTMLMAKSMSDGKEVIYTLNPTTNNPQQGEILMLVPVPPNGLGQGWKEMGSGKMAAKMFQFLQRDINEGRIWYQNTGSKSTSDVVTFEVRDSFDPPNVLKEQTMHIKIIDPPLDEAIPTVAPGVRLGMSVFEDQVVPVTISDLFFHDPDTHNGEIIYTIIVPLKQGEGTLENKNFPLQPFSQFTQADLMHNKIIYHPPKSDVGKEEREVFFKFTVSDGRVHKDLTEYKFNIRILPVNNLPPSFLHPSADVTVTQGGKFPVDRSTVILSDPDTSTADLVLTLDEAPKRGSFEKVFKNSKIILRKGERFNYKEFLEGVFQYSHSRDSDILYDRIVLSASDGKHEARMSINITVLHVDKSAPILLPTAVCRIHVREGETILISRNDFGFMDDDDSDDHLRITLLANPVHGQLVYKELNVVMEGNIITQDDINKNFIRYMADKEIGSEPVSDILSFNVTDSSGNILPNQVLSVTIEPVDNRAPVVTIDEGGEVLLTTDNIKVTDQDTVVTDLLVQIESSPKFGNILSYKPDVRGSEKTVGVPVTQFFVQDLLDGFIHYSQSDHKNKEPVTDNFLFHVTDGVNKSPMQRFGVSIVLLNDEEPLLVTEQLFVQEHQAVVVTNSSLYVIDIDTHPDQLLLTVKVSPQHGTLGRRDHISEPLSRIRPIQQAGTFTYQEILDDLIVYQHNGRATYGDRLTIQVSDGDFTDTSALEIVIGLVDDETPRLAINRGLMLKAGSTIPIKSQDLKATDIDSDDKKLTYTLTRDPTGGRLLISNQNRKVPVSTRGPIKSFTQLDVDQGHLKFEHPNGEITGVLTFKFDVSDPEGNKLIDQIFYITVTEDRIPPKVIANKELVVLEGAEIKITTEVLSFTDEDSEPGLLHYYLLSAPNLGHLELTSNQGIPISEFTQSDLAANSVCYIHTSKEEIYMDSFTFSVSDGSNQITQKLYITITPVDDEIPIVTNNGLRVQEGVRKTITEYDLKAEDQDTPESSLIFNVVNLPVHGRLDLKQGDFYMPVTTFSMADIYNGLISYHHDGSETLQDNFSFTVTDGTTKVFAMQKDQSRGDISVKRDPEAYNLITPRELEATDVDTAPVELTYVITRGPEHGRLENTANPTVAIYSFTQDDIDHEVISYVLTSKDDITEDMFTFDLVDSKPNRISNNIFHIMWSVIEFISPEYNVSESAGVIRVPVVKKGNLKQYSVVTCKTSPDTATYTQSVTRPGDQDYREHSGQVQFDAWQDMKVCSIIINDDSTFEGPERFSVELIQPVYSLIGVNNKVAVIISDEEDMPTIQFKDLVYSVNETSGVVSAALIRTGTCNRKLVTID
ncbi:Hypothetical predicted protein [Mytilus galloprovincialis]|uniref:VWFC domain-containing protein n=1 Tax=Mytilus galloprovincialis TaxID=29158 RepID=A0A8B6F328_MYTGA|nr:Hypothetical predicted protein [Mytilus galloprovincialis]